ncbi:hypothetical protein E4U43_004048 [Claviceps pusilla]|uniref:Ketoreductase domain-containing protein n=1 Tax=Claviceps pusilla TaxID=123648 RepID=A0A9P7SUZ3_9HYPO|nr:hypothetical protein E4U43_004048 [Claviceps pusilla]
MATSPNPFLESLPRPTKTYHSTTYDRISTHHGFDGTGKTVLITGGSMGIGLSIAKAFARAGAARIALLSRSLPAQQTAKAELEAAHPGTAILLYQDSVSDYVRFESILEELEAVDVLVLCAAVYHARVPATTLRLMDVRHAFDLNAISAFILGRAYLKARMPAVASKTLIHLASAAAQMRAPWRSAYGASKAAAVHAMRHLALEHAAGAEQPPAMNTGPDPGPDPDTEHEAETGLCPARVFSFHPGVIYTPGSADVFEQDAMHWEDPRLPADFALWLAGPESDFLSGRYVWANWDVDELIALKDAMARDERLLTLGLVV